MRMRKKPRQKRGRRRKKMKRK
jgi:hypothetical protein